MILPVATLFKGNMRHLLPIACIGLFLCIFCWNVRNGLHTTSDSEQYLRLAHNFLHAYIEERHRIWPPLLPYLLSLFEEGFRPTAALVMNMACMGAGLYCWLRIGAAFLQPRWLWLYGLGLALSTELHWIAQYLWSESLFFLLWSLIAYFFTVAKHLLPNREAHGQEALQCNVSTGGYLLAVWICCALLPFQRHAGLFLMAGCFLGLLLWHRKFIWLIPSSLIPWLLWAWHAQWQLLLFELNGREFEQRSLTELLYRLADSALAFGEVIAKGFLPNMGLPTTIPTLLLLIYGAWFFLQKKNSLAWLYACMAVYLGMHIAVGYLFKIDILRFVAIAWPALALFAWHSLQRWPKAWALQGAWLVYIGARLLHHLSYWST